MRISLTLALVLANLAAFIIQVTVSGFTLLFSLTPALAINGAYWQFFTYMFLHGDPMHLFINMFVLIIFGQQVERHLGWKNFLLLYVIAGLGSAFLHIYLTGPSFIIMLGASGAVFGILTAYGFLFPRRWIIMFPGIPMPAIAAVFVFAGLELVLGVFSLEPGV
ncbi:MAG: rhomboid family intramembrane serine protease, partial [Candidatus Aenigmarchaeota archaeon]